jgi:hypothetical protein
MSLELIGFGGKVFFSANNKRVFTGFCLGAGGTPLANAAKIAKSSRRENATYTFWLEVESDKSVPMR